MKLSLIWELIKTERLIQLTQLIDAEKRGKKIDAMVHEELLLVHALYNFGMGILI